MGVDPGAPTLNSQVGYPEPITFGFKAITFMELLKWFAKSKIAELSFVFVLDELPHTTQSGDALLCNTFARTIFRSLGLMVVLAGTDSTLINALSGPSRTTPHLWSIALSEYPPPTLETVGACLDTDLTEAMFTRLNCKGLRELVLSSRPWLAVTLMRHAMSGDTADLDTLVSRCSTDIFNAKPTLHTTFLQLKSMEMTGKLLVDMTPPQVSQLVVKHMALLFFRPRMEGESQQMKTVAKFYATQEGLMMLHDGRHVPWLAASAFPSFQSDPLLYMVLHGTKSTSAFVNMNKGRVSVLTARAQCTQRAPTQATTTLNDQNADAIARDGDTLEAIACVATLVASHGGGFSGMSLSHFLNAVLSELIIADTFTKVEVEPRLSEFIDDADTLFVPYLFPPEPGGEADVPEYLYCQEPIRRFGVQVRPKNVERIDMRAMEAAASAAASDHVDEKETRALMIQPARGEPEVIWSGECKNHTGELKIDLLKECINRIPSASKLHLLFCDSVADGLLDRTNTINFNVRSDGDVPVDVLRTFRDQSGTLHLARPGNNFKQFESAWKKARAKGIRPHHVVVIVALGNINPDSREDVRRVLAP
eukprot:m.157658 g.157658  ORF g.157658 m.157658 type:complete len:593 (-) comp11730_c0_seq4:151-1929(-)